MGHEKSSGVPAPELFYWGGELDKVTKLQLFNVKTLG